MFSKNHVHWKSRGQAVIVHRRARFLFISPDLFRMVLVAFSLIINYRLDSYEVEVRILLAEDMYPPPGTVRKISSLKRKIIFPATFKGDMLVVSSRAPFLKLELVTSKELGKFCKVTALNRLCFLNLSVHFIELSFLGGRCFFSHQIAATENPLTPLKSAWIDPDRDGLFDKMEHVYVSELIFCKGKKWAKKASNHWPPKWIPSGKLT